MKIFNSARNHNDNHILSFNLIDNNKCKNDKPEILKWKLNVSKCI